MEWQNYIENPPMEINDLQGFYTTQSAGYMRIGCLAKTSATDKPLIVNAYNRPSSSQLLYISLLSPY